MSTTTTVLRKAVLWIFTSVENSSVLDGTEVPAKEDLNIDNNSSVLDGTEVHATDDLNVDNNIMLPQSNADSSVLDLNVDNNNTVLPQAEGYQDQSTHNEVDIESRDKGDSTANGNDMHVPDKDDSNQNGDKADFNKQDISKEENLLQITKKWNLPLMTVSLTDLDSTIKNELAKKGMIRDIRKAKPAGSLKEADPLMDCLKKQQPEEVANLIQDDATPTKQGTSKVNEEKHKTENGEIEIKEYAIKRTKKQKKTLPCTGCEEIFTLVKDFNIHMKQKHPDLKFRCQHCPKVYDTYNARYKHEYKHFQLPYKCRHCDKRFLFPGLKAKHEKQHTGVGLLPCTWPRCKVKLSCPDALRQHIVTHTEQCFPCSKCPKDFNTITNLNQHMKGKHGDGFIALCGAVYDWSDQRNAHQADCKDCRRKREELKARPAYPNKRKQWKKSKEDDDSKLSELSTDSSSSSSCSSSNSSNSGSSGSSRSSRSSSGSSGSDQQSDADTPDS